MARTVGEREIYQNLRRLNIGQKVNLSVRSKIFFTAVSRAI